MLCPSLCFTLFFFLDTIEMSLLCQIFCGTLCSQSNTWSTYCLMGPSTHGLSLVPWVETIRCRSIALTKICTLIQSISSWTDPSAGSTIILSYSTRLLPQSPSQAHILRKSARDGLVPLLMPPAEQQPALGLFQKTGCNASVLRRKPSIQAGLKIWTSSFSISTRLIPQERTLMSKEIRSTTSIPRLLLTMVPRSNTKPGPTSPFGFLICLRAPRCRWMH
mmetsp:Transcript_2296/g.3844  ORF Transcript_2296/g.3844 Transcript_2296/m.3844 type:complete len:220 (+) Transcript_2296:71-730(+)